MTQFSLPQPAEHPLVSRISRLRGRVRTILALHGVGVLASCAMGSLAGLMVLDYFLHIPAVLRLFLLVVALGAWVLLAWRKLLLPLTTRLTDQFLASRVESQNKHLADELMSAVSFIHSRAGLSNALAARHIDMAAQKTASIQFEDAVDFRQPVKSLGIAFGILLIAGVVGIANPGLAGIALQRWLTPGNPPWPHTTSVAFVWNTPDGAAPRVIPMGEKLTVRAVVDKGSRPRVWLTSRTDRTSAQTDQMQFQQAQSTASKYFYEFALQPDGTQLFLRLEAGDNDEVPPVTMRMAPRPVITQIQATVEAPTYAKDVKDPAKPAASVIYNLQNQTGRATQGSLVKLDIKASKPFQINSQGEPDVELYNQNRDEPLALQLNRSLLAPSEALVSFTAGQTIQARLFMRDEDGFQNRIGGTVTLDVLPDALPTIVITDPRRAVERAPDGVVEVAIQATDDWGFAHLRFRADKYDAKPGDPHAFDSAQDIPWTDLAADAAVGSITGKTQYTWDLGPLHLDPGTRLTFYASVQDNYVDGEKTHPWVDSAPLTLQIRTAAEIQEEERKLLSDLNERIKALKMQQEQTRGQTDSIRRIVDATGNISPEQQTQLANLAQQQAQEAASATAVQQRADQIADDLRQNKMQEGDLGKIAQEVSAGMKGVGQQNMPRAEADLSQASQNAAPGASGAQNAGPSAQSMRGATQQQDQAIATMNDLIQKLGAIGDFESLRNDTAKLLEQQKDLIKQSQQLAPETAGTARSALPKDVRDREDKLAAAQKDLADKTNDLLDRMDRAAQPMSQSDPASAESLQNAANAGKSAQVSSNQNSASSKISSNQLSDAGNNQQAAQQGLQQMMEELNKNDLRKLEQLAREVRRLVEDVQKLRDDQDALNKDTVAAGAAATKAAVDKLANRQGTLQQNTIVIQKKAENTQGAATAAQFIQEASDHMVDAATALFSTKQPDSTKPQSDALAALDNALAELKKLQNQIAPDAKNKQLAEFIKQYQAIQKDQMAIKQTTSDLEAKRLASDDKELDRQDEMKVGGLATTQSGLIDHINVLSKDEDLSQVEVVVWMNQQVTEAMDTSKSQLQRQQLGKTTALAQQAAIDRIQLIIDALKEEQQKPSEFASPSGGGGGGGGKPPLVPPLAQLKLLKAMQLVVNDQTKSVDTDLKAATSDADRNQFQTQAQDLGQKEGRIHDMSQNIVNQLLQNAPAPAPAPPAATQPH